MAKGNIKSRLCYNYSPNSWYYSILRFYCCYSHLSLHDIFSTPELPTLEQGTLLDVEEVITTVSKVVLAVLLPELDDVSNC